jgi:hypothetical protein
MNYRLLAIPILVCITAAGCLPARGTAQASTHSDKQTDFGLTHLGSIAASMLDGDVCERIVTPRAIDALLSANARDPWSNSDNYDVDGAAFLQTKKTMLRIASLARPGTSMNLWMLLADHPDKVQVVIRLKPALSAFFSGEMTQITPPEIARTIKDESVVEVHDTPGLQVVLAPVRNSLGHVVAVIEIVSSNPVPQNSQQPNLQHNDF